MLMDLAGSTAHVSKRGLVKVDKSGRRTIVLPTLAIKGRAPKAKGKAKGKAKTAGKAPGVVARTVAALTSPTASVAAAPAGGLLPFGASPLQSGLVLAGLAAVGWWAFTSGGRSGGRLTVRNPARRRRWTVRNPAPHDPELARALEFRRDFHWGIPAHRVTKRKVSPPPRTQVELGKLQAVTYQTHKRGERARYFVHDFGDDGGRRPSLTMDIRNKRLHIVGGSYTVTDRGIEG